MNDVQADFPILRSVNYLNTASIGLVPLPATSKLNEVINRISIGGTRYIDEDFETGVYDGLRESVSRLLRCNSDEVAIFTSVTEAINSFAWSVFPLNGKVLSTSIEFPSVTYPWIRMTRKSGSEMELVEPRGYTIHLDDILSAIDEDTRVICISHVEYLTGQLNDIRRIADVAHEYGAIVIVDGIQAAGYLPIDVKKLGIDVYIIGSYKWLLGPFGAAVAYISSKIIDKLEPALVGWRTREDMWHFDASKLDYASTARKFEFSTTAYYTMIGFAESINYLLSIGIDKIYEYNMNLVRTLIDEIRRIDEARLVLDNDAERGSIATFKLKNPLKIVEEMRRIDRPIEISLRNNLIRISPHLYNTQDDITDLIDALKRIIKI